MTINNLQAFQDLPLSLRSRAMSSRNRLVKRSVANLMEADLTLDRAAAFQAVNRQLRTTRSGGRAAGHGDRNTRPVVLVDDICEGVTVDCSGQETNEIR